MSILRARCINSFIKNILHKEISKVFGATFKMKAKSMYFLNAQTSLFDLDLVL